MLEFMRNQRWAAVVLVISILSFITAPLCGADKSAVDPYEAYIKTSKDFQRVRQDKDWCYAAFPSWTYMPWTYQWSIGYTADSGKWSLDHGYKGAFVNRNDTGVGDSATGRLDWIDQFHLRFYVDHTASKGYLHLWDGNAMQPHAAALHGGGVRTPPVNDAMLRTLEGIIHHSIEGVKRSPNRAAYALDDEISWGHFIHPCMWGVTDDKAAYSKWLNEIYGPTRQSAIAGSLTKISARSSTAGASTNSTPAR
jgi:hypothetical protein